VRRFSAAALGLGLILVLLLPLVGCNRESVFKLYGYDRDALLFKVTPREDEAFALHYVDLLRRSRFDEIEDRLDPAVKDAQTRDVLMHLHTFFPDSEPTSVKTVNTAFVSRKGGSTSSITLEYEFERRVIETYAGSEVIPQTWLLAEVVIQRGEGAKLIGGITVFPISKSYEATNEFTLVDKGISQYAGLSLAVGVTAFTLYAFVLCLCSKIGVRKWIWLIPVLVGVQRFTLNWTTGQWTFTPVVIHIPPVVARFQPYGPWAIDILTPIGAIAFLAYRKKLMAAVATSSPSEPPIVERLSETQPNA